MVAVTFDVTRLSAADTTTAAGRAKVAPPRKSWFARFMAALIAARMEQARREIRIHTARLPYTLDGRGNRLVKTGSNEMPFGV